MLDVQTYSQSQKALPYQVLIADDDVLLAKTLTRKLTELSGSDKNCTSFNFTFKENILSTLSFCKKHQPTVCIVDLSIDNKIGPKSGLGLIKDILRFSPNTRIIVLTGHGEDKYGIEALNAGAISFNQKPTSASQLFTLIKDAAEFSRLKLIEKNLDSRDNLNLINLTSKSPLMQKTIELASFAASSKQSILITGETGTGKGLLAHKIHSASFNQKENSAPPFVRFQPSFESQDLVNSELFGHLKGAFTGAVNDKVGLVELASGGSLFIDEIDFLSEKAQVSLLETLQEKTFRKVGCTKLAKSNFRLMSATNAPLDKIVSKDKLRKDFYHRVSHLKIHIPPLRERKEDIMDLANYFLNKLSSEEKLEVHSFSNSSENKLLSYNWPGNVRELMSEIEAAAWHASFNKRLVIENSDLRFSGEINQELGTNDTSSEERKKDSLGLNEKVEAYKLNLVKNALEVNNQNQSLAAKELKIGRSSLRRIIGKE